jgi:hypothetical protein
MSKRNFRDITSDSSDADRELAPWVEVQTAAYRGVAQNFYHLPVSLILALKQANLRGDGSDILMLYDAAEMAFDDEDFRRLGDLSTKEFLEAIQHWVNASVLTSS